MNSHNSTATRATRTGLKLLLIAVVLAAANVTLPVLRADAGEAEAVVSSRHGLVAPNVFGISELAPIPNPARLFSRIRYRLTAAADTVTIKIYETTGRLIKTLPGTVAAGVNNVDWDLATNDGSPVSNGIYIVRVTVTGLGQKQTENTKIAVYR